MMRICSYCKKHLGEKKGNTEYLFTFGSCDLCKRRELDKIRALTTKARTKDSPERQRTESQLKQQLINAMQA